MNDMIKDYDKNKEENEDGPSNHNTEITDSDSNYKIDSDDESNAEELVDLMHKIDNREGISKVEAGLSYNSAKEMKDVEEDND